MNGGRDIQQSQPFWLEQKSTRVYPPEMEAFAGKISLLSISKRTKWRKWRRRGCKWSRCCSNSRLTSRQAAQNTCAPWFETNSNNMIWRHTNWLHSALLGNAGNSSVATCRVSLLHPMILVLRPGGFKFEVSYFPVLNLGWFTMIHSNWLGFFLDVCLNHPPLSSWWTHLKYSQISEIA